MTFGLSENRLISFSGRCVTFVPVVMAVNDTRLLIRRPSMAAIHFTFSTSYSTLRFTRIKLIFNTLSWLTRA